MAVAEEPGKIHNPLFIYGKSGLGKTHLMHAIGNFITEHTNKRVLYTTSDMFMNDYIGIANQSITSGSTVSIGTGSGLVLSSSISSSKRNWISYEIPESLERTSSIRL